MLRVREVAARLALSLSAVYQLIETGRLKSHCVGMRKGIRVMEDDLAAYLENTRRRAQDAPPPAAKKSGSPFKHLNGERLRAAWRRQGVRSLPIGADNAPSSASSCVP